jgi:thioredoxin-related protein
VKQKFKDKPEVVFLAVNADEDRAAVEPFIKSEGWSRNIYFEDGLAALLRVNSLPTTLIFDKSGKLLDRLIGFLPDRFAEQLTKEITQALESKPAVSGESGGGV